MNTALPMNCAISSSRTPLLRSSGTSYRDATVVPCRCEVVVSGGGSTSDGTPSEADRKAADKAAALIDAIGTVTKDSGEQIDAARRAYDALSSAQKKLVGNYAKLTAAEKEFAKITGSLPFTDVQEHWALEAIGYVYTNDLMNGTGDTVFSPNSTLSRAMLAAVLYRLEGEPDSEAGNTYADVAAAAWYTDAVVWATEHGIVTGKKLEGDLCMNLDMLKLEQIGGKWKVVQESLMRSARILREVMGGPHNIKV